MSSAYNIFYIDYLFFPLSFTQYTLLHLLNQGKFEKNYVQCFNIAMGVGLPRFYTAQLMPFERSAEPPRSRLTRGMS